MQLPAQPKPPSYIPKEWLIPYSLASYTHQDEESGLQFTTGPQLIELQILCMAAAAGEDVDSRFASVTDADKAAIRGTCWANTCRLANLRDVHGNEFSACGGKSKSPSEGGCLLKHVSNLTPLQCALSKASLDKRAQVMAEKTHRRDDPTGEGPTNLARWCLVCGVWVTAQALVQTIQIKMSGAPGVKARDTYRRNAALRSHH